MCLFCLTIKHDMWVNSIGRDCHSLLMPSNLQLEGGQNILLTCAPPAHCLAFARSSSVYHSQPPYSPSPLPAWRRALPSSGNCASAPACLRMTPEGDCRRQTTNALGDEQAGGFASARRMAVFATPSRHRSRRLLSPRSALSYRSPRACLSLSTSNAALLLALSVWRTRAGALRALAAYAAIRY